ncbi:MULTISPECIES: DUF2059 domain-containing protein [Roseobacteraceae]|jgi:hypothetical protein|uniref:DUF2059 domain-containing protein n=1 Tax=Pseudosulfitobacter pseudonitzschiae TaxID=1402135 RepID=A0A221JZX1_9RHOB|nr:MULTISPECIES: DUF2059 domain-containing protein [Roseobacteraceae]ASM72302.1 hypothetical protein SULPSESMR1_01487 [Pseudosulfitobacter pseudonitzschiae]
MIALARSLCLTLTIALTATAAQAADRARLETFLEVTGFDVALDSIRLSASSAPQMLGLEADDFGAQWTVMADDVFDTAKMHDMALDILGETLDDDLLDHATAFYSSDLGRRLVIAENDSHMEDDSETKSEAGQAIVEGLKRIGSSRLEALQRMNAASDSAGTAVRAIQEVQVRFLIAAAAAGVIDLKMEEPDLREALRADEDALRQSISESALSGAAYTYQAFSDAEVLEYAEALEDPDMRKVYDLMNAVQYEIMANRYEALAARMRGLQPSQEL